MQNKNLVFKLIITVLLVISLCGAFLPFLKITYGKIIDAFDKSNFAEILKLEENEDYQNLNEVLEEYEEEIEYIQDETLIDFDGDDVDYNAIETFQKINGSFSNQDIYLEAAIRYLSFAMILSAVFILLSLTFIFVIPKKAKYIVTIVLTAVSGLVMGTVYFVIPKLIVNEMTSSIEIKYLLDEIENKNDLIRETEIFLRRVFGSSLQIGFYLFIGCCALTLIVSIVGLVIKEKENIPQVATEMVPPKMLPPKMIGLAGTYKGAEINIDTPIMIGRDASSCDLVLGSSGISRKHCRIAYNEDSDQYTVTDYSSNGTYLENGKRLDTDVPVTLDRGTIIVVGKDGDKFSLE